MPQKKKASAKTTALKSVARKASKPAAKTAKTVSQVAKATARTGAGKANLKSAKKPVAAKAVKKAAVAKTSAKAAPKIVAAKKPVAKVVHAAVKAPVAKPAAAVAKSAMPHPAHRPAASAAVPVARNVPAAVAKPAAQRISAPMVAPKDAAPKDAAAKALELHRHQQMASATAAKKPVSARHGFKTNEFIVYPAHGVGRIVGIEEQEIAGMALELFVITFEKDKMTLRVPTGKLQSVGMRKLADENIVKRAMETLKGRARIKRTMWSRRAQEYEAKINSGDLISIAEVVRDLYRSETQPEQSYSERQLYEAALDRMAREIAAVDKLDERGAVQKITEVLSRSAKGRRAAEQAEVEVEVSEDGDEEVQAA
jgi:CarD family transcriptional regulator